MKRSIRLLLIVVVVSGILVGAAAGSVAATHSPVDEEENEGGSIMDVDLNDYIPGNDGSDNNTVDLFVIGY